MNARRASALARSLSLHSARRPRPSSNNITAFACPSPTPRSLSSSRAPIHPPSYMVFQAARPLRPTSSSSSSTNTNNNNNNITSPSSSNNISNPILHSQSDQSDLKQQQQHHSLTITSNSTNETNQVTDSTTAVAAAAVAAATAVVTSHHFPINSQHAHSEILSSLSDTQQSYSSSSIDEQNDTNIPSDVELPDSIQSSQTENIDQELSTSTVSSSEHSTDSDQSKLNHDNNNNHHHQSNDAGAGGRTISSTQHPIPNTPPSLALRTGVVSIPHPDKAEKGGEDAFFVQKHAMGVFDGVGGWASIGVDAGLYSKELARLTAAYILRHGTNSIVEALKNAAEQNHAIGTSTACVAAISNAHLIGINLGDSGLLVIRDGQIIYQTTEQQHYFNCPYQIGTDSLDTVDVGSSINVPLRHGDWIVMGTDGLWDNVFAANIVELIRSEYSSEKSTSKCEDTQLLKSTESNRKDSEVSTALSDCSKSDPGAEEAQTISQKLAEMALKVANDERSNSPFAVNAQNAGHLFMGGKIDDITIISALVVDPTLQDSHLQTTAQEDSTRPNGQVSNSNL